MPGTPFQRATTITAPSRKLLECNQHNASLPEHGRSQRLSDIPDAINTRFTGVVSTINVEQQHGMIVPDRLHTDFVYFECAEIQSTGIAALKPNDAVAFSVVKPFETKSGTNNEHRKDIALCITRPDGGLITAEDGNQGNLRRKLGEMYRAPDEVAPIPDEYAQHRLCGYIIHRHRNGLIGYILPFHDELNQYDLIPLTVDDCHFYGNRKLRRFVEVEFSLSLNNGNGVSSHCHKAVHVTLPGGSVMRYNEENHYRTTPKWKRFGALDFDPNDRHKGIITKISPNERSCSTSDVYEITPNLKGYRCVFGYESELRVVGRKALQIGDAVEFHVDFATQRAFHITAEGGYPFLCEHLDNEYSRYLRSKCSLSTMRKEFVEFEGRNGNGFISWFDTQSQCGTIEVIADDAECRYKLILFHTKDVRMKQLGEVKNQKVSFMVNVMHRIDGNQNAEFQPFLWRNDLDLTKRAVNVQVLDGRLQRENVERKLNENDLSTQRTRVKSEAVPIKLRAIQNLVSQRMSYLRL